MSPLVMPYDDDAADLAALAQAILAKEADDQRAGSAQSLFAVGVAEELGGASADPVHLAVVLEEIGAAAAASGVPATTGLLARLLAKAGLDASDHCSGSVLAAMPAVRPDLAARQVTQTSARLNGTMTAVGSKDSATFVVPFTPEGTARSQIAILDRDTAGLSTTPRASVDQTRAWFSITLDQVDPADARAVLSDPGVGASAVTYFAQVIALDSVGLAREALGRTLAYAKERVQFGRTLDSYQAYKHRCAQLYVELALAQSLAHRAMREGSPELAGSAADLATKTAVLVCGEAVQLHGAIGFSWESGLHVLLKRAQVNNVMWRSS